MEDEFGSLALTREQFRELVLNYVIGMHVRRRAAVQKNEENPQLENLERHLLAFAAGFEAEDIVERSEDSLYPSKKLEDVCHELLDARDDAEFWERLEDELAWRDFLLTLPKENRPAVADSGLNPPDIYYKKYTDEFRRHGADRLVVDSAREPLDSACWPGRPKRLSCRALR